MQTGGCVSTRRVYTSVYAVTYDVNEEQYQCAPINGHVFLISQCMITVSNGEGTKTAHKGHMPAETLAKMLLSKLVQEGQA
jgi:hypothetical protein